MRILVIASFLFFCISCLQSCGTLIQPNIKTDMAQLQQGSYSIDPDHTSVLFKISHLGYSKFVGRFNSMQASLDFDPNDPESAHLEAIIDISSIDVNDADFEKTLQSRTWFSAESYPQAYFVSNKIEVIEENRVLVHGALSLRGVSRPVTLNAIYNGGGNNILTRRYTIGFEIHGTFKRSDFGINAYLPAIGNDVELEIHAEFTRNRSK